MTSNKTGTQRLLRLRHYSPRTEGVYIRWVRRYVAFTGRRHPRDLGEPEIADFLSVLAERDHVSAGTQNQALAALLFMYRHVLGIPMSLERDIARAKRPKRLPVVMSPEEVWSVVAQLVGAERVAALLMYGSGLRLMECLSLRIKDLDFAARQITVRAGKGNKDRVTVLPDSAGEVLASHLTGVKRQFARDAQQGTGVALPDALGCKYPNAAYEWRWYGCFRRRASIAIPWASEGGITCTRPFCSVQCISPSAPPA